MLEINFEVTTQTSNMVAIRFEHEVNGAVNWSIDKVGNKFKCPLCEKAYINVKAIGQHLSKLHTDCPFCDLSFVGLPSHLRAHNISANENSLNKECDRFVDRLQKRGYSFYEIDRAIGVAFGVAT